MSAKIETTCPECGGQSEFSPQEVEILTYESPPAESRHKPPAPKYSFLHKECGRIAMKEANQRALDLLLIAGCSVVSFGYTDELDDPVRGCGSPRFSGDDQIEFHQILEDAGWQKGYK